MAEIWGPRLVKHRKPQVSQEGAEPAEKDQWPLKLAGSLGAPGDNALAARLRGPSKTWLFPYPTALSLHTSVLPGEERWARGAYS